MRAAGSRGVVSSFDADRAKYIEWAAKAFALLDAFIAEALLGSSGGPFQSWLKRRTNAAHFETVSAFHARFVKLVNPPFLDHFRNVALARYKASLEPVEAGTDSAVSEKKAWILLSETDKQTKWKAFFEVQARGPLFNRFFQFLTEDLHKLSVVYQAWLAHKTQAHRKLSLSLFPAKAIPAEAAIAADLGVGKKRPREEGSLARSLSGAFVSPLLAVLRPPATPIPPFALAGRLMAATFEKVAVQADDETTDEEEMPGLLPAAAVGATALVAAAGAGGGGGLRRSGVFSTSARGAITGMMTSSDVLLAFAKSTKPDAGAVANSSTEFWVGAPPSAAAGAGADAASAAKKRRLG